SEGRVRDEDEGPSFVAVRHLDSERRCERPMKTRSEADVALQPFEIEIRPTGRAFPSVVKHSGIEESIGHNAPLRLKEEAVLISEALALESPQRGSTADRGQHEKGNLLIVFGVGGLCETVERDDPGFAQDREMLDHLVVDLTEAEFLVVVRVVVERDAVKPTAPGVSLCRAPVEASCPL